MTEPQLIELANEYAYAKAEVRTLTVAIKRALDDQKLTQRALQQAMLKAGVERFNLNPYREVVWIEDTDEIVVVEKDTQKE